jgi:hypothetical protein
MPGPHTPRPRTQAFLAAMAMIFFGPSFSFSYAKPRATWEMCWRVVRAGNEVIPMGSNGAGALPETGSGTPALRLRGGEPGSSTQNWYRKVSEGAEPRATAPRLRCALGRGSATALARRRAALALRGGGGENENGGASGSDDDALGT